MSTIYDLIVIGAGPSGIAAAVEAKQGGLEKILVLEKGPSHSTMVRTFYKEGKRVDAQYAGQEAICQGLLCLRDGNRETYLSLMDHVIQSYQIPVEFQTEVWSIQKGPDELFETRCSGNKIFFSKTVLIAIGRMGKPNQPDYYKEIPVSLKSSKKILFEITSTPIQNQTVLVVGGGDSALEYCDILKEENQVTLSYRQKEFKRANEMNRRIVQSLIDSKKIEALLGSNIVRVLEDQGKPRVIFAEKECPPRTFDVVIYALGGMSPTEFLRNSRVALDSKGDPIVSEDYESSLKGLYLAGDLLGKGKGGGSIISGFNSATSAVRSLLTKYFGRETPAAVVSLEHLRF